MLHEPANQLPTSPVHQAQPEPEQPTEAQPVLEWPTEVEPEPERPTEEHPEPQLPNDNQPEPELQIEATRQDQPLSSSDSSEPSAGTQQQGNNSQWLW